MATEAAKPAYYVYYYKKNPNSLTRLGSAAIVSGIRYRNSVAAGLNTTADVVSITMDDYFPAAEILLFPPLPKAIANKQFIADNYVPDFNYFWRFRKQDKQLGKLGTASYVNGEAYRNNQGFDIDWSKAGILTKQDREYSDSGIILFPPTR